MHKVLILLFACLAGVAGLHAQTDWRDLQNGWQTPVENYADQPYFVILEDGRWLLTITTGPGAEGTAGQHVVSSTSSNNGQTWSALTNIEATGASLPAPDTNVLSSWVVPYQSGYRAPGASLNRVYAIYTWGAPYVTSPSVPRRDTHGPYAFRYTDDGGTTWSSRHIIPYTNTAKDNSNYFSGVTPAGWNVDKPLQLNGKMFFSFTKLNAPFEAPGGSQQGEGYIYRCDNIDTEGNPSALTWKMLPGKVNPDNSVETASVGIRQLAWGSEQEEFDLQNLTSGALLLTYRTTQGWIGETVSTDEGQTWSEPVKRRYHRDGRIVRHPRANCKVWSLASGKYLMWHHVNGGTDFGVRNPVFVSIGTRAGNAISWGEPEILLYHRDKTRRISYPDMMEVGGAMYVSETEKGVSRVHPIDAGFLAILESQPSRATKTTSNLQLEQTGTVSGSYPMPALPNLTGYTPKGFTVETRFQTSNLAAGQTIFQTLSGGKGLSMTVNALGAVDFQMTDGTRTVTLRSDTGTVVAGQPTHISVHVDAPAKIITMVANGKVCDGTNHNTGIGDRTFGWIHFDNAFADVNGGNIVVGAGLAGTVSLLRVYDRALLHTEQIANWRNVSGVSGPAASAGIVSSIFSPQPGQVVTFGASNSYVTELTTPVYTWDFGDGSPTVQGVTVDHSFALAGTYPVSLTISQAGTPNLQGQPVALLNLAVQGSSADAVITASCAQGNHTVQLSAASSTLTNVPDPVYTWDLGDGESATGLSVTHTYPLLQNYTVTLTISRLGNGSLDGANITTKVIPVGSPCGESLVANWTFDSDLTDAVGTKDATGFGNANFQTTTKKIGGGAATFDGVGDYMLAGTTGDFAIGTGTMTVSFWFKVANADKQISDRFLGTGAGFNNQDGWAFFMRTNAAGTISDGVDAAMSDGGGRRIQGTNANNTIDSLDGNWHLLVGVFNHNGGNGTVAIYLDSVLETTIARANLATWDGTSIGSNFPLTFGALPDTPTNNQLKGLLDDVAIWNTALSQSEIDALWNGGVGRAAASLGNTFANWIGGYAGLGGQTGLTDDPDGDGIDNGVENYFGTHPGTFSAGLTPGTVNAGVFTFTHPQGSLAGDLSAAYRWSKKLADFYGTAGTDPDGTTVVFTTQPATPSPGITTVTATVTGTPTQKLFVRVEVTQK